MSIGIFRQTFSRWIDHEGQRLGAALAFYTLLSAAPFALFLLLVLSTFFTHQEVEGKMVDTAQQLIGPRGASFMKTILTSAKHPSHPDLTSGIALFTLLFGASGAFVELRDALNKMWDARPKESGIWGIVWQRIFGFFLVFLTGCLLVASVLATTAVSFIGSYFGGSLPIPGFVLEIGNVIVSWAVLTIVFMLVYRFVPDRVLSWNSLWKGAAVSAILFEIGKALLGFYLSKAGVGSAYGAAGSVVAVSFWIYYSAQIFLLGAEFTYVWAKAPSPAAPEVAPRRAA
ncbi:MAG: YihY/virulence factor BrkB family protein [Bryobacteraceae bacterium]